MIKFENVTKRFGSHEAVTNLNLRIACLLFAAISARTTMALTRVNVFVDRDPP